MSLRLHSRLGSIILTATQADKSLSQQVCHPNIQDFSSCNKQSLPSLQVGKQRTIKLLLLKQTGHTGYLSQRHGRECWLFQSTTFTIQPFIPYSFSVINAEPRYCKMGLVRANCLMGTTWQLHELKKSTHLLSRWESKAPFCLSISECSERVLHLCNKLFPFDCRSLMEKNETKTLLSQHRKSSAQVSAETTALLTLILIPMPLSLSHLIFFLKQIRKASWKDGC